MATGGSVVSTGATTVRRGSGLSLSPLTAEGAVPPGEAGDALALAGFHVGLDVVAEHRSHALVLAHVVQAVLQEGLGVDEGVAGLILGCQDLTAQSAQVLHLLWGAAGLLVLSVVWLAAAVAEREGRKGRGP